MTASWSSGSNAAPSAVDALHAEAVQLGEELLADHLDALEERVGRASCARGFRGVDRAIEVVDDLEQADEHVAPAALGVFRELLAHARARVLEFLRRLAVLRQVLLRLLLGLRPVRSSSST